VLCGFLNPLLIRGVDVATVDLLGELQSSKNPIGNVLDHLRGDGFKELNSPNVHDLEGFYGKVFNPTIYSPKLNCRPDRFTSLTCYGQAFAPGRVSSLAGQCRLEAVRLR
jgi:hypothetical protein